MNCEEKRPVALHTAITFVQACLVIALFVFAARGKAILDDSQDGSGIEYYTGAFIVASVYSCLTISTLMLIVFYQLGIEKGNGVVLCTVCSFACLGLPSFIIGVIFTALFGLANCKKNKGTNYDLNEMCSYDNNIDNNYNTAVVCLILIVLLFVTNILTIFLLCKYGGDLLIEEVLIQKLKRQRKAKKRERKRAMRIMVRDQKIRQAEIDDSRMDESERTISSKFSSKF